MGIITPSDAIYSKCFLRLILPLLFKDDMNGDNPLSLFWKNVLRFRWAASLENGKNNLDYFNDDSLWMTLLLLISTLTFH